MNLLIGSGRVATHLSRRFEQLNIAYTHWCRSSGKPETLEPLVSKASRIYLAISDSSIFDFFNRHIRQRSSAVCIHFSGNLFYDEIIGAHPLTALSSKAEVNWQRVHFVIDCESYKLSDLLPGFSNSYSYISKEDKAKYHAYCVMAGNFPFLIWHKVLSEFRTLNIPSEALTAYLQQNLQNFMDHPKNLTGPLVRGDNQTIENNLDALSEDSFKKIYQEFVSVFQTRKGDSRERFKF